MHANVQSNKTAIHGVQFEDLFHKWFVRYNPLYFISARSGKYNIFFTQLGEDGILWSEPVQVTSETEDQIQRAMRKISSQRTTFLITHRLSQIRWADRILVLKQGRLADQGSHEELLARSEAYQRIFARYE